MRKLAHEAALAIDESYRSLNWMVNMRDQPEGRDSWKTAEACQAKAIQLTQKLMDVIRAY